MVEKIQQLLEHLKYDFNLSEDTISNLKRRGNDALIIEGDDGIMNHIQTMISNTKSSIIFHTPQITSELLQFISQKAYEKKAVRFLWITNIDYEKEYSILLNILMLGNIQIRNLKKKCNYYYFTRDAKEVLIGKCEENSIESISVIYEQEDVMEDMSREMGPYLLKESVPILIERDKIKQAKLKVKIKKKIEKNPEKREKILKKYKFNELELKEDYN